MPPRKPYDDEDFDELDELEIYNEEDFDLDEEDEYDDSGRPNPKHHDDLGYLDGEDEDYEDDLERYVPIDDDEGMGPEDELPFMGALDE